MKETIIQFGEGNFLRGFVDYFIHKLHEKGLYDDKVVVVQPIEKGLVPVLNEQAGVYNLYLRGTENGRQVVEHTRVTSISRGIDPYADFDAFLRLADSPDFRFVVSNTTEAGIAFDSTCTFTDKPARSFPGKVTQLLFRRFQNNLPGFVFLACELIDNNGGELRDCVLRYADLWKLGDEFKAWIDSENTFCNTLVDRIVTGYPKDEAEALCKELGYQDKLLDTAEIFHLWVIEGNFEQELPLQKAGFHVVWTDDVRPYKKRKVRVLNGAHTSMVCPAMLAGLSTVGECLADEQMRRFLNTCLFQAILPVLGENEENMAFTSAVLERFSNPFIKHQLSSISLNSVSKYSVRVLPTVLDFYKANGVYPKALVFSLAALLVFYKTASPQDDAAVIQSIRQRDLPQILSDEALWGADLSGLLPLVRESIQRIARDGIREAIEWAIS